MAVFPPRASAADPWEFISRRGPHHYGETPDFFTSDLIDALAAASYRRAVDLNKDGLKLDAEKRFLDAWRMNWIFPEVPLFMGYAAAVSGDWVKTARLGAIADLLFAKKIKLANDYRALPEVKTSIRRQAAEAATQRGVALEKMAQRDEALAEYRYALALYPLAQTRYDLAVLDWGRDWKSVEENLSEALRLDPNHADARRYLAMLQAKRR
jgi:tetratricopeptide (TPR) repeat protein